MIGKGALRHCPSFGALHLATADAIKRSKGAAEGKAALLDAESLVKGEGIFHFRLASYECQPVEAPDWLLAGIQDLV